MEFMDPTVYKTFFLKFILGHYLGYRLIFFYFFVSLCRCLSCQQTSGAFKDILITKHCILNPFVVFSHYVVALFFS